MKYYGVFFLAVMLLLGACNVEKPVVPKWDIDLAVPLINEKYYVADLVDSVDIYADENDVVFLQSAGDVSTPEFGYVSFTPPSDAKITNVTIMQIPSIPPLSMPYADPTGKVEFAYAKIHSGSFKTHFTSLVSGASLTVTFSNLYTANLEPVVLNVENSLTDVSHDLAGYQFGLHNNGTPMTELEFTVVAHSTAPVGTNIGVFSFDATSPMSFEELQGRLTDFTLELEDNLASIDLEYPQDINQSVTLQGASVVIDLVNSVGFEAEFSGQFFATNEEGQQIYVDILADDGQNFVASPGANHFEVTNSIADLIQIMPTHIEIVNGLFTIRSGAGLGYVHYNDYIDLSYVVKAPFTFQLHANDIIVKDEVEISISSENAEKIKNNAKSASLELKITNKVPIGATATAYFSASPNIDVADPESYAFLKQVTILGSNATGGELEQEIPPLTLDENEIQLFSNPKVYLRWKFSFVESGEFVTIHASTDDYIQIKSMLNAKVAVEDL